MCEPPTVYTNGQVEALTQTLVEHSATLPQRTKAYLERYIAAHPETAKPIDEQFMGAGWTINPSEKQIPKL